MKETQTFETIKSQTFEGRFLMRVIFLPVNQRWVVLFGGAIIPIGGERSFESLADVKFMLRCQGLEVTGRSLKISVIS